MAMGSGRSRGPWLRPGGWRESRWAKVTYESMFGNDQQVAHAFAVGLTEAGVTTEAVDVGVAPTTIGPERHAPGTWSRAVLAGVSAGLLVVTVVWRERASC